MLHYYSKKLFDAPWMFVNKALAAKATTTSLPLNLMGLSVTSAVILQTYRDRFFSSFEALFVPLLATLGPTQPMQFLTPATPTQMTYQAPRVSGKTSMMTAQTPAEQINNNANIEIVDLKAHTITQPKTTTVPQVLPVTPEDLQNVASTRHMANPLDFLNDSMGLPAHLLNLLQKKFDNNNGNQPGSPNPFYSSNAQKFSQNQRWDEEVLDCHHINQTYDDDSIKDPSMRAQLDRARKFYDFLNGPSFDKLCSGGICQNSVKLDHGPILPKLKKSSLDKKLFEDEINNRGLGGLLDGRVLNEARELAIKMGLVKPEDSFIWGDRTFAFEEEQKHHKIFAAAWQDEKDALKMSMGFTYRVMVENEGAWLRKTIDDGHPSLRMETFFALLRKIDWANTPYGSLEGTLHDTIILRKRMMINPAKGYSELTNLSDYYMVPTTMCRSAYEDFRAYAVVNRIIREDDDF